MRGAEPDYGSALARVRRQRAEERRGPRVGAATAVLGLAAAGIALISSARVHEVSAAASLAIAGGVPTAQHMEINAMFRTGSMAAAAVVSVAAAGEINLVQGGTFEAVPQGAAGSPCFSTHLPLVVGTDCEIQPLLLQPQQIDP